MITIELDKERRIRFTMNALADAERVRGLGLPAMIHPLNVGHLTTRALLWAGLKWEDRSLTLEKAGDLVDTWIANGHKVTDLEKLVYSALEESGYYKIPKPEKDADTKNEERKKKPDRKD